VPVISLSSCSALNYDLLPAFRVSSSLDGYMCKEDCRKLLVKVGLIQDTSATTHLQHAAGQVSHLL